MEELKKVIEQLAKAFDEFKKANDERIAQLEKKGVADPTLLSKMDKANEAISALTAKKESLEKSIEGLQTAMNRTGGQGGSDDEQKAKELAFRQKAKEKWMRKGDQGLTIEEVKALASDSDPDGGYLISPERSAEVVKKSFESSPLRQLASVQTISGRALEILEDLDEAGSGWTYERGSRSNSNTPQFKRLEIVAHELYAQPAATQTILDDAAIDLEAWLAGKVAEKFARDEATAFISGTGVGKPQGIIAYTAGTSFGQIEQVVSGSAATITADGLLDLQGALKEAYQGGASFLMQRATETAVRKLKDGQNRYFWEPGLVAGKPNMLLGKPVHQANDMQALGAGNLVIAYGDFKAGYQIVDRVGIRVLRDPFTSKPNVLFYTTKRVGGGVKNFEAIKLQKCST